MDEDDGPSDKPHEPTQRKLDQARERGELPRSADLLAAASYAGLLAFALTLGEGALLRSGETLAGMLAAAGSGGAHGAGTAALGGAFLGLAGPVLLVLGLPAVAAALAVAVQRAWVFAPSKLAPRLARISPLETAKQKFGPAGLFEFAKSFVKLTIVCVALGLFLVSRLPEMIAAIGTSAGEVAALALRETVDFLILVTAIALVMSGADLLWQRFDHLRQQRMSRKELIDEMKESEGDPFIRQQRRQRGYEIATNRMMTDVPRADVVIVNPTHYAVALRWDRGGRGAPVCVAKGVDAVALRIRAVAAEAGVPVRRDPPTARALYATVAIGQEIPPEHYRPVAAAIRFADAMRRRAGRPR